MACKVANRTSRQVGYVDVRLRCVDAGWWRGGNATMMTGDEMRRWRERHRMTQDQAAALHQVDARTVRRWETSAAVDARAWAICEMWDLLRPEQRKAAYGRLSRGA